MHHRLRVLLIGITPNEWANYPPKLRLDQQFSPASYESVVVPGSPEAIRNFLRTCPCGDILAIGRVDGITAKAILEEAGKWLYKPVIALCEGAECTSYLFVSSGFRVQPGAALAKAFPLLWEQRAAQAA